MLPDGEKSSFSGPFLACIVLLSMVRSKTRTIFTMYDYVINNNEHVLCDDISYLKEICKKKKLSDQISMCSK